MESPWDEHRDKAHSGNLIDIEMKIKANAKSNLLRQASDVFYIDQSKTPIVLNRKSEWGQNLLQKIVVEDSD